jgi:hypothetical protein
MQTWWLSFVDPERPAGERFLGVCLVDIDAADAAYALAVLRAGRFRHTFRLGAEWLMAATRKAHLLGCNPGGQVQAYRVDVNGVDVEKLALAPRNRLMSAAELKERGLA